MPHPFVRAVLVASFAAAAVVTVAAPASAGELVVGPLTFEECLEAVVELPKGSPEVSVCRPR